MGAMALVPAHALQPDCEWTKDLHPAVRARGSLSVRQAEPRARHMTVRNWCRDTYLAGLGNGVMHPPTPPARHTPRQWRPSD